ncbi:hypothetical protein [Rhodococcus sp. 3A]|uniref:hypothetical protein n=1 Tax=Rhodococcus sp. 3A TaxID=2834581 RepID=UPI0016398712|nr:hypothetical protein [Rhodococcus sp. 3A]MBC2640810.1 hypothetical protein [Rhodococcus sp. 3A]
MWGSVIVMRGQPLLVFCLDGLAGAIEALNQVLGFGVVDGQRRGDQEHVDEFVGGGVELQASLHGFVAQLSAAGLRGACRVGQFDPSSIPFLRTSLMIGRFRRGTVRSVVAAAAPQATMSSSPNTRSTAEIPDSTMPLREIDSGRGSHTPSGPSA